VNIGQTQVIKTVTYLTEGVENALSVKQSISNANISSCFGIGQLKNISLSPETKTVVICADNDGINFATKKALEQSVAKFLDSGLEVKLTVPLGKDPSAKYDYNQMLTDKGVNAIRSSLNQAVLIKSVTDLGGDNINLSKAYTNLCEKQYGKEIDLKANNKGLEVER
jgi:hypothetical protein